MRDPSFCNFEEAKKSIQDVIGEVFCLGGEFACQKCVYVNL